MSRPNAFAGALAPIVLGALHPAAFLTGTLALALVGIAAWLARTASVPGAAATLAAGLIAVLVARTAQNAAHGDPDDSLGSSGGSWADVIAVSGRILAINLVWTLPVGFAFAGWAQGWAGLPWSGPAMLLLLASSVIPPMSVVMGVGSPSFGAALAPSGWAERFGGRAADFAVLLALSIGGTLMAIAASGIVVLGLGAGHPRFGIFLGLVGAAWTLGVAIRLLGRLGGAFVRTGSAQPVVAAAPSARPLRPSDFDPHPSADGQGSGPYLVFGSADHWTAARAGGAEVPVPPISAASDTARSPVATLSRPVTAVAELEPEAPESESVLGRLRANLHIEEDDRDLALEDAEYLVGKFGPHPLILARVAVLQHRLGHDAAGQTARRAVDAARAVNNMGVLADLYEEFRSDMPAVGLTDVEHQRMAASLAMRGHYEPAIDLYDSILAQTPQALPVVKAMIQLAEDGLRTDEGAERALRIYEVVESRWRDHPFVDFVDRGREEARRRRERTAH